MAGDGQCHTLSVTVEILGVWLQVRAGVSGVQPVTVGLTHWQPTDFTTSLAGRSNTQTHIHTHKHVVLSYFFFIMMNVQVFSVSSCLTLELPDVYTALHTPLPRNILLTHKSLEGRCSSSGEQTVPGLSPPRAACRPPSKLSWHLLSGQRKLTFTLVRAATPSSIG